MAQRIMPAFEVEEEEGPIEHTQYKYERVYLRDEDGEIVTDEAGRKIIQSRERKQTAVELERGWMVYFPRGHSIRITNPDEMVRLGFFTPAQLVDINSESEDDGIPQVTSSLKQQAQRKAAAAKNRRRAAQMASGSINAEVNET